MKRRIDAKYNKQVTSRIFLEGDLVLRRENFGKKNAKDGKMIENYEVLIA